MEFLFRLYDTLRHLSPVKLNEFFTYVGPGKLYVVIFAIIFCETGLVVLPFLPGDSLLFAIGAIGADANSPISLPIAAVVLVVAALTGDNTNYWIGHKLGPAVFNRESSRLLNKKHLVHAQQFYERYGSKTIILARFVPIVRTFAPFVAGIGRMNYARFLLFSILGAMLWVGVCMSAGYALGQVEFVQKRFEIVVLAIIVISVAPAVVEVMRNMAKAKREAAKQASVSK
jgi:membrane-associated protein